VQAVTILVDPQGAEKVALGLHEGKLHLVLRNPEDGDTLRVAGLNTNEMLGGTAARVATSNPKRAASSSKPAAVASASPPRAAATRGPKPTVRMIREAKVTELTAPKDSM
jgi:Flp pilus assembly protein CpaB